MRPIRQFRPLRGETVTSGIIPDRTRRDGRVAEGGGLLNRCTVKSCTGGSNPPLSANSVSYNSITVVRPDDAAKSLIALQPFALKNVQDIFSRAVSRHGQAAR